MKKSRNKEELREMGKEFVNNKRNASSLFLCDIVTLYHLNTHLN